MAELKTPPPAPVLEYVHFTAATGTKTAWISVRAGVAFARFYDGQYDLDRYPDSGDSYDAEHRLEVLERAFSLVGPDEGQSLDDDEYGGSVGHLNADDGIVVYTARCGGERSLDRTEVEDTLRLLHEIADRMMVAA